MHVFRNIAVRKVVSVTSDFSMYSSCLHHLINTCSGVQLPALLNSKQLDYRVSKTNIMGEYSAIA